VEKFCRVGQAKDDSTTHVPACWIPKATNTLSEYVIFIAFPLQQWLHERASMLRYTYIVSPVTSMELVSKFSYTKLGLSRTLETQPSCP